ncbi:MAG: nucleotidyl transferase AbiEii/AbiGii toxin family protein [Candidatus Bathyarchaeota archaeon]|nr:nucleotidyl transferase AbiEii/AbiGii toxin family protein [Candidatus Bathyarchaeota archaeon]
MLDKKYVTFYARSSRVPLDVAERDVVLTYVLRILSESILQKLAFKGGTCLKKVYFGSVGRFSMDLDFTSSGIPLEELKYGLRQSLDKHSYYGIEFRIAEENVRAEFGAGGESYLAVVHYTHSWNANEFTLEVSYREEPLLPLQEVLLFDEMYFKFCEFPRFAVRCLQKEELLAEKLRAAFQRIRARDLYDLYLFSGKPFDRDLVRKLVVVKCWNVREPFNPDALLSSIAEAQHDWDDLQRLVRKGDLPSQEFVTRKVMSEYAFLKDLDSNLLRIFSDSKAHKEKELVARILAKKKAQITFY